MGAIATFAAHLERPVCKGHTPPDALTGAAGGAACGDLVRISLTLERGSPVGEIEDAGFDASGCGAIVAAGSATVSLIRGRPLLEAARLGARQIAAELGGLSPAKMHAAELACDALHRALGAAAAQLAQLAPAPERTVVAMSGGVDSAVAALMSMRAGGEAVALTVELWADPANDGQRSCCSAEAVRAARALAHGLGMPHLSVDLRERFRAGVVEPWLAEHAAGLTPYPCVRCNGGVRLTGMLDVAARLGAGTLATGHYARVRASGAADDAPAGQDDGRPLLRLAVDERKDQSYALAALPRDALARMRFPLGGMRKEQVREIAREAGLTVARKPDSQDLCFLAGTGHAEFLARHGGLTERPGEIVDDGDGTVLGTHRGSHLYTVGQRHGLGIGGGRPLYVLRVDADRNRVVVGDREALRTERVAIADAVLHRDGACVDAVKINYRGARRPCALDGPAPAGSHDRLSLRLQRPLQRTATGQLACLYSGDLIVGHGTVARE